MTPNPVKLRATMTDKRCDNCRWKVFKDSIGMDYCIRPKGYQLLTAIESGFVEARDLPKGYDLCGKDKKFWEARGGQF